MKAFIDSDVLIWHLRGEAKALNLLKILRERKQFELWTGAMQRAEVVIFMRPTEEETTLLFLSQFKTSPVDQKIIDSAGELYRQYNPTHGTDVNDAIVHAHCEDVSSQIDCSLVMVSQLGL